MTKSRVAGLISFSIGAILFVGLAYQTGWALIGEDLRRLGMGLAIPVLVCGLRYGLRTAAWYLAIEKEHRHLSLLQLFKIRLAGETVGELMFAGMVVGESAKAVAAARWIPAVAASASVFIENLVFGFSVVAFLISGMSVLLIVSAFPLQIRMLGVSAGLILLLAAVLLVVLANRRWLLLSWTLGLLKRWGIAPAFLNRHAESIQQFEASVYGFYAKHRLLFWALMAMEFMTHWLGVFEAYWILRLTQGQGTLLAAFLLESTSRIVNAVFLLIPLRLGVDEGGAALVLQTVGYSSAAGVSLAVVRKIRLLFWLVPGLFLIGRYSMEINRDRKPQP